MTGMTSSERKIEVRCLSEASNHAVVHLPGRAFPGSVIQGDTLRNLLGLARTVRSHARRLGDAEAIDDAVELHVLLEQRLLHYQDVLLAAGSRLPYEGAVRPEP